MKSKYGRNCSDSCDCKEEVTKAKAFISNLKKRDKFSQKQRDSYSVVHFDLKGSTRQMRKNPTKTITHMLLHNKMCRNIVEKNGGITVKELGDAIMVSFKTPGNACECAIKVIRNLRRHGGGIHTKVTVGSGTMWKIRTANEDDIYGVPVNLCTRMSKYAKEDQILFEEKMYTQLHDWLVEEKKIKFGRAHSNKLRDFGDVSMRRITVF